MKVDPVLLEAPLPTKEKSAKQVRLDLAVALMDKKLFMVNDFKALVKHTGGMLSTSMGIAYAKGIDDAIKLIFKLNEGENNG